jgi:hypothetical protein
MVLQLGKYTARACTHVLEQDIFKENYQWVRIFSQAASLGCLVDSAFDLRRDIREHQYNFPVSFADKALLIATALKYSVSFFSHYKGAVPQFLKICLTLPYSG